MSFDHSSSGRTITAFFDTRAAMQKAVDELTAAGIEKNRLSLVEGGPEPFQTKPEPSRDKGFWAGLRDLFMPEEDRHSYGEGLRRGGFLLAVRSDPASHDRVVDILDREGAVDMDERETTWRNEGWDPARIRDGVAAESTFGGADSAAFVGEARAAAPAAATDLGATVPKEDLLDACRGAPDVPAGIEADSIPSDEEAPGRVGVRDPNLGRARVRSYMEDS